MAMHQAVIIGLAAYLEVEQQAVGAVVDDGDGDLHVLLFDDETREMAKEIVRCNALDRVYMALDYFDASINRISAWTVGIRSWQKALLMAMVMPNAQLKALQDEANFTKLMVMQEEMKTLPFGDIWAEYCKECGVAADTSWYDEIMKYEKDVLSKRK